VWDETEELLEEGSRLCEDYGYRFFHWYFWALRALLAAARGDEETCREYADRITSWARPRGVHAAVHYAEQARALIALGLGDVETAYQHARAVTEPGTLASHVPHALWMTLDLVEACVRSGRQAEAARHVAAVREAGIAELSPRLALLVAGAAALCAEDSAESTRLFDEALAIPGAERWAFELARVRLAYGERLRRGRATAESRLPLAAALATFEELQAKPWAQRAAQELRAAGAPVSRPGRGTGQLTPQEMEIAQLAASGLTNKQIAQRLLISHRTVGAHLYQIFPKLGITSRTMLRDSLDSLDSLE
jgi:DNA-binding CsgD family transcriptional regulator